MQSFSRRGFAWFLLAAVMVAVAPAQSYRPLLGHWTMTSETGDGAIQWSLVLKESDGKLAGTVETDNGEQPARELSYVNGVLQFKAPYQGLDYDILVKPAADKLEGTWSGGGDSGKTSGTRK